MRDRMIAAGCALAAVIVIGCAHQAGPVQATVQGCAGAAATAIRQHVTVRSMPAACRGLSPVDLDQSVVDAVHVVAADVPKARMRHRASLASSRLGYLIAAAERAARAAARPGSRSAGRPTAGALGAGHSGGLGVGAAVAALITWLLTAATGGYLLARWAARGGLRRTPSRSAGLPPGVILGHFGLAIGGLLIWIGYLLTDAAALAWLAVGFLLPVAGLGIATLVLSIPETAAANANPAAGGPGPATGPVAGQALPVAGEATPPGGLATPPAGLATAVAGRAIPAGRAVPARTPMPVVIISVHGLLATATLLLVLLAAIAAH